MDLDKKDLAFHYYEGLKIVNDLINEYFDLLATHHQVDIKLCDQISIIKAKTIEIGLLRKIGCSFDSDEVFKTCQGILWAGLQMFSLLHNFAIDHQFINNTNDEPKQALSQINELKDLINTLKYLEAHLGIVHDYEQYFKDATLVSNSQPKQTVKEVNNQNINNIPPTSQPNPTSNQQPNLNQQTDHPVRIQAKQVEQWLLDHFPSRQEYMDLAFELKTISNKLQEIEQLIKTKKKPN